MRDRPPGAERKQGLDVFDRDDQQCGSRARAPPFVHDFQRSGQLFQAVESEPSKVLRVLMKWMTKWRHQVEVAARCQHAHDFAHDLRGIADMLKDRVAFHTLKCVGGKGKLVCVRGGVDSGYREQIDVHATLDYPAGASDV